VLLVEAVRETTLIWCHGPLNQLYSTPIYLVILTQEVTSLQDNSGKGSKGKLICHLTESLTLT
jgi:hypothetical protein